MYLLQLLRILGLNFVPSASIGFLGALNIPSAQICVVLACTGGHCAIGLRHGVWISMKRAAIVLELKRGPKWVGAGIVAAGCTKGRVSEKRKAESVEAGKLSQENIIMI